MATMTTAPVRTDAAIRESVLSELKWDPKISSPDIAVAVKDGVVTLSGFVSSYWEKDTAEKAVKRVYGVRGLANDIQVKLLSKRTDPEIARDADLTDNLCQLDSEYTPAQTASGSRASRSPFACI